MKIALQSLNHFAPHIVHDCPYTGTVQIERIGFKRTLMLMLPSGEYKYIFVFKSERKEIMKMELEYEIV
jgi:hypothetical protein